MPFTQIHLLLIFYPIYFIMCTLSLPPTYFFGYFLIKGIYTSLTAKVVGFSKFKIDTFLTNLSLSFLS